MLTPTCCVQAFHLHQNLLNFLDKTKEEERKAWSEKIQKPVFAKRKNPYSMFTPSVISLAYQTRKRIL